MMREVVEVRRGAGVGRGVDGEPRSMLARGGGGEDDRPLEEMSFGSTLGESTCREAGCDCSLAKEEDVSIRAWRPSTVAAMTAWLVSSFWRAPRIWASMALESAMVGETSDRSC